ncbi:hypothetical protein [Escherichia phage dw-ec]|nr:hypothetical protein [Escherichia phage BI-EHEC]UJQ43707.1 hypothetical protein [Escherichia phage dw-ec]
MLLLCILQHCIQEVKCQKNLKNFIKHIITGC